MTAHDEGSAGDVAGDVTVPGTPSGKAQGDTGTDAADPATSDEQREDRVGSAGGGAYPINSGTSDNEGAQR
jgi:hypothetical protein